MKSIKLTTYTNTLAVTLAAALINVSGANAADANTPATDWKDSAISPVANPLFFESPLIGSEIRPLFIQHNIPNSFIGGDAQVYALQARWAVTERLAIIATKDGYIDMNPDVPGLKNDGWADIAAGVKYALIDDREHSFILTPGVKFQIPVGDSDVFQGEGDGEFDIFVSSMKGWDKFHATASAGTRIPVNFAKETAIAHYSLQLDYATCHWFIPFVTANGITVLSETENGPALGFDGYDLINFGASNAGGFTEVTVGTGFRSKLTKRIDIGFAYEKSVTDPAGLFDDRYTVDMIIHF